MTGEPKRAYRCNACIRAGVEPGWRCLECERKFCEHAMRDMRLDGSGYCRRCRWARARKLRARNAEAAGRSPLAKAAPFVKSHGAEVSKEDWQFVLDNGLASERSH